MSKSPRRTLLALMALAFALAFLAWSGLRLYSTMQDHARNDAPPASARTTSAG